MHDVPTDDVPTPAAATPAAPRVSYPTMLWRAWRLRCPRCGRRRLFKNWISMHPRCIACGLKYQREPGYFLGSIYVNYGLTAMLVTIGYFVLAFTDVVSPQVALAIVMTFAVLFPIWFFRYARSLWLGFDQFWDPSPEEPARSAAGAPREGAPTDGRPTNGAPIRGDAEW